MTNEIVQFFTQQESYRYKKGDIIIRVGDVISGVYYIKKGYIKVYSLTESGEENIQYIYQPGEIFPLIWVFNNRNPEVFYETLTPVHVLRAKKQSFLEFLEEDRQSLLKITEILSEMLHSFYERIHNLELTNSYPRAISRIIYLAKRLGKEREGKIVFDFPVTQRDIANSINMTRETASKEMSILEKKGIIQSSDRSSLIVFSLPKLEKELLLHYERKSL